MKPCVSEQAVLLGRRQSLVGILARPAAAAPASPLAIVILNTGIIHRVGHHRMYVAMSRALAQAGHVVLRFDFSGIGDSDPRNDNCSPLASCMDDIKDALDWLQTNRQVGRVVLVGLCSGADHAVLYGHTDRRVVALVLMDPSIPATARHYIYFAIPRLRRLRNWITVLTGRSRMARSWIEGMVRAARRPRSDELTLQDLPFHPYLERSYQNTVAQDMQILAVFTGESTRQTYQDQILDAFPHVSFGNLLRREFFSGSDHTFALESDRVRLTQLILDWLHTLAAAR